MDRIYCRLNTASIVTWWFSFGIFLCKKYPILPTERIDSGDLGSAWSPFLDTFYGNSIIPMSFEISFYNIWKECRSGWVGVSHESEKFCFFLFVVNSHESILRRPVCGHHTICLEIFWSYVAEFWIVQKAFHMQE